MATYQAQSAGTPAPATTAPAAPTSPLMYRVPSTGGTIDLNTVPMEVVNQLIQQDPSNPALTQRAAYLNAANNPAPAAPAGPSPIDTYNQQVGQVQKGLARQVKGSYQTALNSGLNTINNQADIARGKQLAEEASLGRLTSPVSISNIAPLDSQRANAVSQFTGQVAGQQAGALSGLAGQIANLKTGAFGTNLQNSQFGQNLQFNRDKLQSDINQQNEQNGLARYLNASDQTAAKNQLGMQENAAVQNPMGWVNAGSGLLSAFTGSKGIKGLF